MIENMLAGAAQPRERALLELYQYQFTPSTIFTPNQHAT